jgi:hypothetical protein
MQAQQRAELAHGSAAAAWQSAASSHDRAAFSHEQAADHGFGDTASHTQKATAHRRAGEVDRQRGLHDARRAELMNDPDARQRSTAADPAEIDDQQSP